MRTHARFKLRLCLPLVLLGLSQLSASRAHAQPPTPQAQVQSASDPEMAPRPTPRHRRQHRSFVPMVVGYGVIRFVSTGDHSQARAKRFDLACTPLPGGGYANMRLRW